MFLDGTTNHYKFSKAAARLFSKELEETHAYEGLGLRNAKILGPHQPFQ